MSAQPASSVLWKDAPDGKCWACRVCSHATMFGKLAGEHSMEEKHGLPQMAAIDDRVLVAPPAASLKRPMLAVRAGDYVQAGYDLRLALEIATVAINEAERSGTPAPTINRLRGMIKQLRL